jgi:hypothetical protein
MNSLVIHGNNINFISFHIKRKQGYWLHCAYEYLTIEMDNQDEEVFANEKNNEV